MLKIIHIFIFTSFFIFPDCFSQSLVINEVLASNKKAHYDGFGEFDDWIEIYNPLDSPVNLGGMFITDDLTNPSKYQFSQKSDSWLTVAPKGYLLLWLDGDPEQGRRHINFSLNKENGVIAIYDKNLTLLDKVVYKDQKTDMSLGRLSVDDPELGVFEEPSFTKPNKNGLKLTPDSARVFSNHPSGFYTQAFTVSFSSNFEGQIYYTTDGSEPTKESTIYSNPVKIDSTMVLRAIVVRKGYNLNSISTWTFFVNTKSTLPVLSLTTDPDNLWHKRKGIYRKFEKRGWERAAFVEYFDFNNENDLQSAFTKSVDIRIAGKTSRRQPKKSFAIFSNNLDGKNKINYKIFDDKPIESFSSFWVRADATSGRNVPKLWVGERFKNELLYQVNKDMNGNVDMQAYQPVQLYLNGEYWGLYNLMERKGSDFIANNHGEDKIDILTSENTKVVKGSMDEYLDMIDYITVNNPETDSVYNNMAQWMDMDSYIDYWVYEVYSGAHDIAVNIRYWKARKEDAKWRWISYDQDSWNTVDENSFNYFIEHGKVFLLQQLMKNITFRNKYFNRMCDFLNTGLSPDNVTNHVNRITEYIAAEVEKDRQRWQDTMLYVPKNERINWILNYAKLRPDVIRSHMLSYFNLKGSVRSVKIINQNGNGVMRLNTILVKEAAWEGYYLSNVPLNIEAIPNEGYVFVKWKNRKLGKKPSLTVNPEDFNEFVPVFKKLKKRFL